MKNFLCSLCIESILEILILAFLIWNRRFWRDVSYCICLCSLFVSIQSVYLILLYYVRRFFPSLRIIVKIWSFIGLFPGIAVIFCFFLTLLFTKTDYIDGYSDILNRLFIKNFRFVLTMALCTTKIMFAKKMLNSV